MSGGDAVFWDIVGSSGVIGINISGFPVVLGPWVIVRKWGTFGLHQLVVSWEDELVSGSNLVYWLWATNSYLSNLLIRSDTAMSSGNAVFWDII